MDGMGCFAAHTIHKTYLHLKRMASQIGLFFLFIGLIILLIFGAIASAGEFVGSMCLAGSVLFALGATIMWRNRKPPAPSDRFHTVKRMREKRKSRD